MASLISLMPTPNLKKIVLPVGWNALVNDEKKTSLVIGEYKYVSEANTALRLVTAKSEAELLAALAGFSLLYPKKK